MAKKCIPGVVCFESITPFLIGFAVLVMSFVFFKNYTISPISPNHDSDKIVIVNNPTPQNR